MGFNATCNIISDNKVVDKAEFDNDWTTAYQIGTQKEADLLFDHADANDDGIIDHQDLPFIFHFFDVNCKKYFFKMYYYGIECLTVANH